jgi:hypothetical protein
MGTGPGKHARRTPHTTVISLSISFAVAFAAVVTALIMQLADSGRAAAPRPEPAPVAVTQPVTQQGRLIAISPESLTAQGPDGVARTYRVDDQTHGITAAGSRMGGTAESFTVNDEVSIIGVTRGADNVATTVVHRDVANLNGPPMDYALP